MALIWDESLDWHLRINAIPGLTATCQPVIEGAPNTRAGHLRSTLPDIRGGQTDEDTVAHALVNIFNSEGPFWFRLQGLLQLRDICLPWVTDFIQDVALNPENYNADYRMQQEAGRLIDWHERHC